MLNWLRNALAVKDAKELRERLDEQEKAMRRLEEEWTEVYSKFRTLQMRTAKQVQRLEASSPETLEQPSGNGTPTPSGDNPLFARLTPAQRRVQEQIEARRARGGGE